MINDPRSLCLCFLLGTVPPAMAQDLVGGGIAVAPWYPGADSYRIVPRPLVNFQRGPFFISTGQGLPGVGLKMNVAPDVAVGVRIGLGLGRDEKRSERLEGLGDIDSHAEYGVFAEWKPGRWSASIAYSQAAKSGYGGTLSLRGSYAIWQQGRHNVQVGAGLEWGNSDHMQTWFGVTPEQSARSGAGLATYRPSSGLRSGVAFASWTYRLTERWHVTSVLGAQTLVGDAADSPIVERKTAAYGGVGLSYSF
ncbi:MAG: MipA/OmpV family protein [Pigmentiphaga sp.]|uniref:MipA/OmpV family protein n=1 Tax=Pigmentiphaga sp. TaxID=1977564 RepID=UPI0029BA5B88|nr:MipA/OmpV family protein [Pigmentiphaga sp.]MDX3904796.1 MipA/OmpV family protein [Pigmentiphaga sp.]